MTRYQVPREETSINLTNNSEPVYWRTGWTWFQNKSTLREISSFVTLWCQLFQEITRNKYCLSCFLQVIERRYFPRDTSQVGPQLYNWWSYPMYSWLRKSMIITCIPPAHAHFPIHPIVYSSFPPSPINPLKTSPRDSRARVYWKCML